MSDTLGEGTTEKVHIILPRTHHEQRNARNDGVLPVGIFFADLGDQERAHASAGTTTQRVGDLEALQAVAGFGLLADHVEDRVDELGALGVVALGPVVTGTRLSKDKVVLDGKQG